jgi:hypothetical protein
MTANEEATHGNKRHHSDSAVEELALPIIDALGAVGACRRAIDLAAASRRGVLVVGSKGCGKTIGLARAREFFSDLERERRALDSSYAIRRTELFSLISPTDYRGTAVMVAKKISPTYSDRVRGRKKDVNEIRIEVAQLCIKQRIAVLLVDEADHCSPETIGFFRDLMAQGESADDSRFAGNGGTRAAGVGVVLVGTDDLEKTVIASSEAGHRWATALEVGMLDVEQVKRVYSEWFPRFAEHVSAVGDLAWTNYLASVVCRGQPVSLRTLENHTRIYVHGCLRGDRSLYGIRDVPFRKQLFESTATEAAWGGSRRDVDRRLPKRRRSA